jgi:branched-chain amino acid transport system substrate-binding protein
MKRGLESLKNFDAEGLIAPVTVTAKDHGGGGKTRIDMWDGAKWVPQTDWFSAYDDVVQDIVKKESGEFAKNKQ